MSITLLTSIKQTSLYIARIEQIQFFCNHRFIFMFLRLLKLAISVITLASYLTTSVAFAENSNAHISSIKHHSSTNKAAPMSVAAKKTLLKKLKRLVATGHNHFTSQASNGGMNAAVSVNPSSLGLTFSQKLFSVNSSPTSKTTLPVSIFLGASTGFNPTTQLLNDYPIDVNIPYIQPQESSSGHTYYTLSIGGSSYPMIMDSKQQFKFIYYKKPDIHITHQSDDTIVVTQRDNSTYIFKKVNGTAATTPYQVVAKIGPDGKAIYFQYAHSGTQSSITLLNSDQKVVAKINKQSGSATLFYQDKMGHFQHVTLRNKSDGVSITNPLNESTLLTFDTDKKPTKITLADGAYYTINYGVLSGSHYIVSGYTEPVNNHTPYVSSYTEHFNNSHDQDITRTFSVSSTGNNFSGNNIQCDGNTFAHVTSAQDWLMECGFRHQGAPVYRYSTLAGMKIPVFTGTLIPSLETKQISQSYNYLHLKDQQTTSVNNITLTRGQTTYGDKITSASSVADLSQHYNLPSVQKYQLYDATGNNSLLQVQNFNYSYDSKGFLAKKIVQDSHGNLNTESYTTLPGVYHPILQTSVAQIRPTKQAGLQGKAPTTLTTNYSKPSVISKSITVGGHSYTVNRVAIPGNQILFNGKVIRSSTVTYNTEPTAMTFAMPVKTTATLPSMGQYVNNTYTISNSNNVYTISNTKHSLSSDTQGRAPQQLPGTQKTYNLYGGLIKSEDPVTGDIVTYDSYDALGRPVQVSYLPAGNADDKQTYRYQYDILNGAQNAGFRVTMTQLMPTGKGKGVQVEKEYDTQNHVVKTLQQLKDRSGFYATDEAFYNLSGQISKTIHYYYDEKGQVHPQQSLYFYNRYGKPTAVQHPNGSTSISVSDPYHLRKISYTLLPTSQVINNPDSLCFDPLQSTPDHRVNTACRVASVQVSQSHSVNQGSASRPVMFHDVSYKYNFITDPAFTTTTADGKKVPLYDSGTKKQMTTVFAGTAKGQAPDPQALESLADTIKNQALANPSATQASTFVVSHFNAMGQVLFSDAYHAGMETRNVYSTVKPNQVIASTVSTRNTDGSVTPVRTTYNTCDAYGNIIKTEVATGAYDPSAQKVLVGERTYTSLGFLLNATTMVGDKSHQVSMTYDTTSGFPTKITDPLGNSMTITYDTLWHKKPHTVVSKTADGHTDFTLTYTYDANGNLTDLKKTSGLNKLISEMAYTYDPVNQRLLTTTITHPDGSQRILSDEVNNYFVPVSSTYGAPAAPVYTQTAVTDALGLPVSMSYKGSAGQVSLGTDYNPDLSVKDKTINHQVTNSYIYDSVGNLVSIANDLNGKPVRTYGYGYNTKGQIATRTAKTENGVSTQTYTYTPQGQLLHFTCNGKECPQNLFKQPVSAIDYSYQPLFNSLNTVDETLNGGSKQLITYQYKNTDPTQVSGIDYAGKGHATFSYDGDGNITAMQKMTASGKLVPYQMSYDSAQNLTDVTINDHEKIHYTYDASGQQIAESDTNAFGKTTTLQQYYNGSLAEQSLNGKSRYYVAGGSFYDGRYESAITDGKQLTGSVVNGKVQGDDVYMPYGQVTDLNQAKTLALTLQKSTRGYQMKNTDQVTGWQFLGNGYRAYDPALRLFTKHDSASPWGAGGINAYNYAGNDPINSSDPTGHYTENDVNDVNKTMKAENKQLYDNYHKSQLETIFAICFAVAGLLMALLIPGPGEFIEGTALGILANVVFFTAVDVATTVSEKLVENGVLEQKGLKPSQSIGEMMSSTSFWEGVGIDAVAMVGGETAGLVIKEAGRAIGDARSAGRAAREEANTIPGLRPLRKEYHQIRSKDLKIADPKSKFPGEKGYRIDDMQIGAQDIFQWQGGKTYEFDQRTFINQPNASELENSYRSLNKNEILQFEQARADIWHMRGLESREASNVMNEMINATTPEDMNLYHDWGNKIKQSEEARWGNKDFVEHFMNSNDILKGNDKLRNLIYNLI